MDENPLARSLADQALASGEHPALAVTALMVAAASILQRDFGPELAAQIMLDTVAQARAALAEGGLIATATQH